jgi:uncharacterized protein YjbJ (UPF0337 family)
MNDRRAGTLEKAFGKLKEKAGQLLGERKTVAEDQQEKVERDLRETYGDTTDAIRTRSALRQ